MRKHLTIKPPSQDQMMKEAKEDYQKGYGFRKSMSPQIPVDKWDYEHIKNKNEQGSGRDPWSRPVTRAEKGLVLRQAHGFTGRRTGSLYSKKK